YAPCGGEVADSRSLESRRHVPSHPATFASQCYDRTGHHRRHVTPILCNRGGLANVAAPGDRCHRRNFNLDGSVADHYAGSSLLSEPRKSREIGIVAGPMKVTNSFAVPPNVHTL